MGKHYLFSLNQAKTDIAERHQSQQDNLRKVLDQYIQNTQFSVVKSAQESDSNELDLIDEAVELKGKNSFASRWLPGPLSYPWLVMLASVPHLIKEVFNAS